MSEGHSRLAVISALIAFAAVFPGADRAQAQFFPGFGAPQQINTARGAIQLAPGWRLATTPVRAGQGYRVAVRSEYGEQRNMFIGADGALAVESAPRPGVMRAPARPLTKSDRAPRKADAQKPKINVAVIRAPGKPQGGPAAAGSGASPASMAAPAQDSRAPTPQTNDASPKARGGDLMRSQAPGFAHGVPINPLD